MEIFGIQNRGPHRLIVRSADGNISDASLCLLLMYADVPMRSPILTQCRIFTGQLYSTHPATGTGFNAITGRHGSITIAIFFMLTHQL